MTSNENIKFVLLIGEGQKINIRMNGMIAENDQRKILNQSMAFSQDDFLLLVDELNEIQKQMQEFLDNK